MISSEVWNCCLSIIKLSIGIDTSAAIFGIMRFNETKELRFKIVGVTQKEARGKRLGFSFGSLFLRSRSPTTCSDRREEQVQILRSKFATRAASGSKFS